MGGQTDRPTDRLMPSDKCNLIMVNASSFISALFNVASFGNMPFR